MISSPWGYLHLLSILGAEWNPNVANVPSGQGSLLVQWNAIPLPSPAPPFALNLSVPLTLSSRFGEGVGQMQRKERGRNRTVQVTGLIGRILPIIQRTDRPRNLLQYIEKSPDTIFLAPSHLHNKKSHRVGMQTYCLFCVHDTPLNSSIWQSKQMPVE